MLIDLELEVKTKLLWQESFDYVVMLGAFGISLWLLLVGGLFVDFD